MRTIKRINLLLSTLNIPAIRASELFRNGTPAHDVLDRVDKHFGIITRFKLGGALAPVGERLRRLERHMEASRTPPYFWLGAQAEQLTG